MSRRKGRLRGTRTEEVSLGIVYRWTFAKRDELEDLVDDQSTGESLTGEQSGFVSLGGESVEAPEVHACRKGAKRYYANIRDVTGSLLVGRINVDGGGHGVLIAADEHSGGDRQRNKPHGVVSMEAEGTGPYRLLIREKTARRAGEGDIFWLSYGGGWLSCRWIG